MSLIKNTVTQSFGFYRKKPFAILAAQIPMGILVIVQRVLEPHLEKHPILISSFLLPIFSLGTSWGTALTFLLMGGDSQAPIKDQLLQAMANLFHKFKALFLTSLLTAIFFALGLYAYLLPGIVFIALYFFVPILVVSEPEQPVSRYFYQSKQLVTKSYTLFFLTLSITLFTFFVEIPISYLVEFLSERLGYAIIFDVSISMFVTGFIDIFICYYFLSLKSKGNP